MNKYLQDTPRYAPPYVPQTLHNNNRNRQHHRYAHQQNNRVYTSASESSHMALHYVAKSGVEYPLVPLRKEILTVLQPRDVEVALYHTISQLENDNDGMIQSRHTFFGTGGKVNGNQTHIFLTIGLLAFCSAFGCSSSTASSSATSSSRSSPSSMDVRASASIAS